MPLAKRAPGGLKPGAAKPESNGNTESPAESAEVKKPQLPWSSPSEVSDMQGLSMMLFSLAGVGKTTLLLSLLHSLDGGPMLILNFDEELRSISDLTGTDVMVWPGVKQNGKISGWNAITTFTSRLLSGNHPFKIVCFDTLNSLYDKFALPDVKARNSGVKDPRQLYGEANDMVLSVVSDFSAVAREKGLNVVFTCHAEEKQVGEQGPIFIRPKITPGVVLGINQRVSLIGYLSPPVMGTRSLQLATSRLVATKIHQPRTGPQVPDKIKNPDLGLLVNHLKHGKPYPVPKGKGDD
jgi:AAA domain